ncbi:MAG TPA: LamG-like jellyroll fold domain-containing protein, partial [Saprospiraceae bacterium]|nr:LamG-like jellyroll fold domain-containing protein [Saprospiraceae bacterium]
QLRDIVRKKHATLFGDWAILPSGQALTFDGNDRLDITPSNIVFTRQHNFTLEFWMKSAPGVNTQTLLSNGKGDGIDGHEPGWSVSVIPTGNLQVVHGGQVSMVINKDLRDNNWHHVTIVMNRNGNLNTYLDGLLQTSLYGSNFGEFAGAKLFIAARGWPIPGSFSNDQYFNGDLDDIRVWNTVRTREQIQLNMQHRLLGNEPGLLLYLPFEGYENVNGIEVLTPSIMDVSESMLALDVFGNPMHQPQDPNIKLPRPVVDINFTYSVNNDKIILTLHEDPVRIENIVLDISAMDLRDLHGNDMAGPITWTAYVNKNQLHWNESELSFDKPEKTSLTFDAEIENTGGIELSFDILNLPDWLTATPSTGSIGPVSTKTIQFSVNPNIGIGDYSTDVNLLSGQGFNDKLIIDVHVFGVPPTWDIDPAAYAYSMNIVADLDIFGELSDDPLDRVVAYVNGEVRGLTTLEYIPELDRYLGFLEVYSNVTSGEQVSFKVWDASTGTTYAGVNTKVGNAAPVLHIPFVANTLVGNAVTPARWIVTPDIIQEIPMNAGWTWISFNVLSPLIGNLDAFFAELAFEDGDQVLSQTKNATYNPSSGWQGNLLNPGLEIKKMYKCDFTHADILRVAGPLVNPELYPISIVPGWNWIPYLSREPIEINEALSSFDPTTGDQVKSQDQFAVYHPTQGWVGTLKYMEPGKGYMLFADNAGTIIYPLRTVENTPEISPLYAELTKLDWRSGREHQPLLHRARNMTLIATLESEILFDELPLIASFAEDQLLQVRAPMQTEGSDTWSYYFTLQGDESDKVVHFEVYHADGSYAGLSDERIDWGADLMLGTPDQPFVLHLTTPHELFFSTQPNPFSDALEILFEMPEAGIAQIAVFDIKGTLAYATELSAPKPGLHKLVWDGRSPGGHSLSPGVYVLQVRCGGSTHYEKLVKH